MFSVLKQTFQEFGEDRCARMAAALSYYTIFSMAPLLIIIMTICGLIWDPGDIRGQVYEQLRDVVGDEGASQVKTMLASARTPGGGLLASAMSMAALVFGATSVVGQLQSALNDAWGVRPGPQRSGLRKFLGKRLLSAAMIIAMALGMLTSLVLSTGLTAAGNVIAKELPNNLSVVLLQGVNLATSVLVVSLLLGLIYRYLPDGRIAWSDVCLGAVVTGVLFMIGKELLGVYLGRGNIMSAYGAAGSLTLIMLWVYYSAMVLLWGAEFTQVWARRNGHPVTPVAGAVRVEQNITKP